jgi:plastocyanin
MLVRFRGLHAVVGALGLMVGVAVALSCGNPSGSGNGCNGTGAHTVVNATNSMTFEQNRLTINAGESVCWQNLGSLTHTVTAVSATIVDSSWTPDSVNAQLSPGALYVRAFGRAGVNYFYKCSIHAGMTGEVDVR